MSDIANLKMWSEFRQHTVTSTYTIWKLAENWRFAKDYIYQGLFFIYLIFFINFAVI